VFKRASASKYLSGDCHGGEARALLAQAIDEVGDFLAERRRRCRLAVRARHHWNRGVGMSKRAKPADQGVQARQQNLVARVAQHQRIAQVVDVLRRAGEVHELAPRAPCRHRVETRLDEILDCLHVVIGLALDTFDLGGFRLGQLRGERIQHGQSGGRQTAQLDDARLRGQRLEP
jgi:hypothetical protein